MHRCPLYSSSLPRSTSFPILPSPFTFENPTPYFIAMLQVNKADSTIINFTRFPMNSIILSNPPQPQMEHSNCSICIDSSACVLPCLPRPKSMDVSTPSVSAAFESGPRPKIPARFAGNNSCRSRPTIGDTRSCRRHPPSRAGDTSSTPSNSEGSSTSQSSSTSRFATTTTLPRAP